MNANFQIFPRYRNDAPSGVLLALEKMKGIRVLESFTPTTNGAEPVNYKTVTNAIWPTSGKQAAVTIGAGVTGLEMSSALARSGLFALFASHGK
jgi:FAD/FMN-containing dehydrogenase